jgi:hypothetical protein
MLARDGRRIEAGREEVVEVFERERGRAVVVRGASRETLPRQMRHARDDVKLPRGLGGHDR